MFCFDKWFTFAKFGLNLYFLRQIEMGSKQRRAGRVNKRFKGKTVLRNNSANVNKQTVDDSNLSNSGLLLPAVSISDDSTPVLQGNDGPRPSSENGNISFSKISSKINTDTIVDEPCLSGTVMFDLECLQVMFSAVVCPECHSVGLTLLTNDNLRMGSVLALYLRCKVCDCVTDTTYTSKRHGQPFDINRRLVYAMRSVGCGRSEAVKFSSVMNMPPPLVPNSYSSTVKIISSVVCTLAEEVMQSAAIEVKRKVGLECGVSGDGSWQRRGFSSHNGVVTVISVDTGKILDTEVISKICHTCKAHEKDDVTTTQYATWKADHNAVCEADFQGSSGSMEPVGAARIFLRSVNNRGLEYTEFYGDGDSKAYKTVVDADPYNGKPIHKKECIGHYQKRLGTALRKAAKDHKLGGKNKLTAAKIDKMQNYFGIALREDTASIEIMQKGIWASLFHLAAKDDQPLHSKCPEGDTSWCSYQRAKAAGTLEGYKHKVGLPIDIVRKIKPIYE